MKFVTTLEHIDVELQDVVYFDFLDSYGRVLNIEVNLKESKIEFEVELPRLLGDTIDDEKYWTGDV